MQKVCTIMQEAFFAEYADATPFDWVLDVSNWKTRQTNILTMHVIVSHLKQLGGPTLNAWWIKT